MNGEHNQVETEEREMGDTSRRALLGAAASGLALAVGGLFLPELVEDAEARKGANGGKLGGRRGKNRRGRDKQKRRKNKRKNKRKHKNKRQNGGGNAPGRGIFDFRDTGLTIRNRTDKKLTATLYYQDRKRDDIYGPPIVDEVVEIWPREEAFVGKGFRCGVNIKDIDGNIGIDANVRNMVSTFPRGEVWQGTNVALGGDGGTGLIGQQGFFQNEAHADRLNGSGTRIELKRYPDDDDWINFELTIG
jgi:hypothetical protein